MPVSRRAALAAFAGALTASSTAFAQPVTLVDALGRSVSIKGPINRVIATTAYEELTAVAGPEGWRKVVAFSRIAWEGWRPAIYNRYAPVIPGLRALPDVGDLETNTFSAETVIALRPDVVILPEWGFAAAKTQVQQIEAAGIPIVVVDYNAQLLERHLASTRALGLVMGTTSRAEDLARFYEAQYRDVLARVARAQGPKKTVYVELGQAGPETTGNSYNNAMWGRIITTLNADNIAAGKLAGPWGPLAQEAVIAANPDLILIAGSSWPNRPKAVRTGYDIDPAVTRASLATYAARPGWGGLKAVTSGQVHAIEHGLCRTLVDFVAMQYIARQLYPEQFSDIDPVQSFRDYHARYLPVTYSGTWMLGLKP